MNEEQNNPLDGFTFFDNSGMSRVVDKITITKSSQFNFPAAFYKLNSLSGKQGVALYYNNMQSKIGIRFTDTLDPKGFKLVLSNEGKYGAYISAKSFLLLNKIELPRSAGRYEYKKFNTSEGVVFIIDLNDKEEVESM